MKEKIRKPIFLYMVGGLFFMIGSDINNEMFSLALKVIGLSLIITGFILYFMN